jgi:hypothetical protein
MESGLHDIVLTACRQLMRPVIRILIRSGVVYRQFTELCKELYVEIATADHGLRGRPTNVSRVALLTGLDRKEIKRIRDGSAGRERDEGQNRRRQDRVSRVLSGWYQDPRFSTGGNPLELALHAADGPSFDELLQRYGGDVPGSAILKELLRSGAVERRGDSRVRAIKRYYMPVQTDVEALRRAGSVLSDLGDTVVHNLYRPARQPSRFEGRATNPTIDPAALDDFRRFAEARGQEFLEQVDDWLTAHEGSAGTGSEPLRIGTGVYWIEGPAREGEQ